jgi:hypothetical protein
MARAVAVAVSAQQVRERVRLTGGDPNYEVNQVDRAPSWPSTSPHPPRTR